MNNIEVFKLQCKAKNGDKEALYELGQCYLFGIGLPFDIQKAYEHIEKAKAKGMPEAEQCIKDTFEVHNDGNVSFSSEFDKMYDSLKKMMTASERGDPYAQWMRGFGKLDDKSSEYMFNRGLYWVRKSAEQHFPPAQCSLGIVYCKGDRIKGKTEEGLKLVKESAQRLWMPAIKYLASRFSIATVLPLLEEKVNEGDLEAIGMLGNAYLQGNDVEQDVDKGITLIRRAADGGDKIAMYNLALIYDTGLYGVEKDLNKAIPYYEMCAKEGDVDAMNRLREIYKAVE